VINDPSPLFSSDTPWTRINALAVPPNRRPAPAASSTAPIRIFDIDRVSVALHLEAQQVLAVRVALGGVAYRPWRSRTAEQALVGQTLNEETANAAAQAKFSSLAPGRAVIPSRSNREPGRTCRSVARLGLRVG
jgi:CO/xanthine dehydrogenase FAD-binding subunit